MSKNPSQPITRDGLDELVKKLDQAIEILKQDPNKYREVAKIQMQIRDSFPPSLRDLIDEMITEEVKNIMKKGMYDKEFAERLRALLR